MKHIANYKPKDFAELLNVSVKTLQRWDREGLLIAKRTPTNRRYYTYDQYLEFTGKKTNITFECKNEDIKKQLIELSNLINGVRVVDYQN